MLRYFSPLIVFCTCPIKWIQVKGEWLAQGQKQMIQKLQGVSKNVLVSLLGTRFEARNCISECGPRETYRDNFLNTLSLHPNTKSFDHDF
jgi:hypothetical protein